MNQPQYRSVLSRRVRERVDEMLHRRRVDGSLPESQWVAVMSRLHPDGFAEGYVDALSRSGEQGSLL